MKNLHTTSNQKGYAPSQPAISVGYVQPKTMTHNTKKAHNKTYKKPNKYTHIQQQNKENRALRYQNHREALRPYQGQRLPFEAVLVDIIEPSLRNHHHYGLVFVSLYAKPHNVELDHVVIHIPTSRYKKPIADMQIGKRYAFTALVSKYYKPTNYKGITVQTEAFDLTDINRQSIRELKKSTQTRIPQPTLYVQSSISTSRNHVIDRLHNLHHSHLQILERIMDSVNVTDTRANLETLCNPKYYETYFMLDTKNPLRAIYRMMAKNQVFIEGIMDYIEAVVTYHIDIIEHVLERQRVSLDHHPVLHTTEIKQLIKKRIRHMIKNRHSHVIQAQFKSASQSPIEEQLLFDEDTGNVEMFASTLPLIGRRKHITKHEANQILYGRDKH